MWLAIPALRFLRGLSMSRSDVSSAGLFPDPDDVVVPGELSDDVREFKELISKGSSERIDDSEMDVVISDLGGVAGGPPSDQKDANVPIAEDSLPDAMMIF